jgi:hypothetical protein
MSDVRNQIIRGINPKDVISEYEFYTNVLHQKFYVEDRRNTIHIPKDTLKKEMFLFLVEGYHDKKIWDEFVDRAKTKVRYIRVPKRHNSEKYYAGKDAISETFRKDNLKKYSQCPLVIKIKNNRVIGIIDRDFEPISLEKPQNCINLYKPSHFKNLFVTETNDIETFFLCYGGFSIYKSKFVKTLPDDNDRGTLCRKILEKAEILGCAFLCSKNKVKFTHIDSIPLEDFSRILEINNPQDLIKKLIEREEKNHNKDPIELREFYTAFHQILNQKLNTNYEYCLSRCRGHTIMQVLCCYCSNEVKRQFKENPQYREDTPENVLFEKIFEQFKIKNTVECSKLFLSLLEWEKQTKVNFLKRR